MPGFTISSEDGKAINNTNPLPVKTIGGGSGGAQEVEIVHDSSGILQAIQDLAGGDSSNEIYADDVTVTDSAAALPDVPCAEVWIQSDSANTENIYIGNDTTQNYTLKPGDSITLRITNVNIIYAATAQNTATLHYIARGPAGLPGGGSQPVPVELTGSIVQDDRLRVAQRDTIDLAVLAKLMADTADGTLITDLIKAVYGRTLLLLKPYADNVIWTRSSPSTAYWAVGTWEKVSGSKSITASTGTGPTASGASNQIKFGSGGGDTMAEYVFNLDFTGVKTLNIYTKLEEFGEVGSQIIISINDTQIYSSGAYHIAREHDWTLRTFDVSGYTGVLPLKITTRAGYTASEPRYQFGNLTLEV